MDALEEKQFEYFKRLETTIDEGRKDEINELLNIIDLQLKEISSLKAAINAGTISASKDELTSNTTEQNTRVVTEQGDNDNKERKKGKTGLVAVVIALAAVVAIVGVFMLSGSKNNQNTTSNDSTTATEESRNDNKNDNPTKLGVHLQDGTELQQLMEASGVEETIFSDGLYIFDITNPALAKAGAQIGDRVVSLNGENARTIEEFGAIVSKYKPGDEAVLVVSRSFENVIINTKFVSKSDLQPERTTGEEIVEIDGRRVCIYYDYYEDAYGISILY